MGCLQSALYADAVLGCTLTSAFRRSLCGRPLCINVGLLWWKRKLGSGSRRYRTRMQLRSY